MRKFQREIYYIAGSRIFIRSLIDEGKYSRMPNIKIIEDVIDGKPGYDIEYLNGKDRFIFKRDHYELSEHDIAEGFEHFMYECINASMDPEYYALMRRATGILRKHGYEERKEMYNDDVYHLIEAADKCRKEIVLCLLGKPGIGKTEAVERFARDHNRNVVHIITSQILPSEVSGMTMPNQETKSMDVFDHYRLSHMKDGDILFFDELLKGQQQVLNACLTLIQERRLMSGTELPDVLIIAAANPLASPTQLPLEIRQRFMFVNVEWNRLQWCEYMESLGFKEEKFIDELSRSIERKLGKDDVWNTLTPRTATKLCLWLRDSGNDPSVRGFIIHSFGSDVLRDIDHAVFGNGVKSAEAQTAEKIIEILTPINADPDIAWPRPAIDEAMTAAKAVADGEETDLTELMSKLMALPEWGEIQNALLESEIEEEKIEF